MAADLPPLSRRFLVWLGALVAAGFVVRLVYILGWKQDPFPACSSVEPRQICGDALYYHGGANLLVDGHGFVDVIRYLYVDGRLMPGADHPPLYQLYLAGWSLLGLRSVLAHQIASAVLGCATIVTVGLLGRRLAGERAGLLAAAGAAGYAAIWVNDGLVMSESLSILMTALMILQAYRAWARPTLVNAVMLGAVSALGALTRAELLLWLPLTALPLAVFSLPSWRARVRFVAVVAVVALAVLAPWSVRNAVTFRKPVLLSTGSGITMAYANCDRTYYGELIGYWYLPCAGPVPVDYDESEADALYRRRGLSYAKHHLERVPAVTAVRVARLWGVWNPRQMVNLDLIENRERPLNWVILIEYYVLVPLAVGGGVVLHRRRVPLTPMVAMVMTLTVTAALAYGITRFRTSADVLIVVLAGVALDALLRRRRQDTVDDLRDTTALAAEEVHAPDGAS